MIIVLWQAPVFSKHICKSLILIYLIIAFYMSFFKWHLLQKYRLILYTEVDVRFLGHRLFRFLCYFANLYEKLYALFWNNLTNNEQMFVFFLSNTKNCAIIKPQTAQQEQKKMQVWR